jgi:hypothetical protein
MPFENKYGGFGSRLPTPGEMDRLRREERERDLYGPQDAEERLRMQGGLAAPPTSRTPFTEQGSTGEFNLQTHAPHVPAQHMRQFVDDAGFDQMLQETYRGEGTPYRREPHENVFAPESYDLLQRLDAYQRQRADDELFLLPSMQQKWRDRFF